MLKKKSRDFQNTCHAVNKLTRNEIVLNKALRNPFKTVSPWIASIKILYTKTMKREAKKKKKYNRATLKREPAKISSAIPQSIKVVRLMTLKSVNN